MWGRQGCGRWSQRVSVCGIRIMLHFFIFRFFLSPPSRPGSWVTKTAKCVARGRGKCRIFGLSQKGAQSSVGFVGARA